MSVLSGWLLLFGGAHSVLLLNQPGGHIVETLWRRNTDVLLSVEMFFIFCFYGSVLAYKLYLDSLAEYHHLLKLHIRSSQGLATTSRCEFKHVLFIDCAITHHVVCIFKGQCKPLPFMYRLLYPVKTTYHIHVAVPDRVPVLIMWHLKMCSTAGCSRDH